MKLTADSGSTKTLWALERDGMRVATMRTEGINPYHLSQEETESIIRKVGMEIPMPDEIEFYGAGCTPEKIPMMEGLLRNVFPESRKIIVDSDLLGAAKALCGSSEGIACILGTGANSCFYDGERIVENISPMGYILGDEGSGAVIGRTFVGELYKGFHEDLIPVFERETGLTKGEIIERVYRQPMANRFLASLNLFIAKHLDDQLWLRGMIEECFRNFFRKNVAHYHRPELPVHFVGSIAFHYRKQLNIAAEMEGYRLGRVMKSPLEQ